MRFFLGGHFEFSKSAILNFFCFISVKNPALLYEVTFFFLHYGWFFQNLGKEAVRTFMYTTVSRVIKLFMQNMYHSLGNLRCYCTIEVTKLMIKGLGTKSLICPFQKLR